MCNGRRRRIALIAAFLGASRLLIAQGTDPLEAPRRAVLAAQEARRVARAEWVRDSVQRATLPVVATVGAFTLRADTLTVPVWWVATIQSSLAEIVRSARATLGPVADSLFAGGTASLAPVHLAYEAPSLHLAAIGALVGLRVDVPGAETRTATVRAGLRDDGPVRAALTGLAEDVVARGAAATVARLGASPLLSPWTAEERMLAYRLLRLSRSPSAAACVAGGIAACRVALALVPAEADTIDLWFDAGAQQALVRAASADSLAFPARAPLHRACVIAHHTPACRAVLGAIFVRSPTSLPARRELLRLALVTGGSDAYHRLRIARDTTRIGVLEYVSGVPLDSLVAVWRADVLRGRAPAPVPPPTAWAWTGVTTVLLFGIGVRRGLR